MQRGDGESMTKQEVYDYIASHGIECETTEHDYLDDEFTDLIGVHPNENIATVWLSVPDLLTIIKEQGNPVHIVEIP